MNKRMENIYENIKKHKLTPDGLPVTEFPKMMSFL